MRPFPNPRVERFRISNPPWDTYHLPCPGTRATLTVIASDGEGWEHVSVSLQTRPPTYTEMQFVKEQFWDDDEWVVEFHPSKQAYVNNHPFCLHLWKPVDVAFPTPPSRLVGIQ